MIELEDATDATGVVAKGTGLRNVGKPSNVCYAWREGPHINIEWEDGNA